MTVQRNRTSTWNSLHALGPVRRCALLLRGAERHDDGTYTLRCAWCGRAVGHDVEIDHLLPRVYGGGNEMSNLVPACSACNVPDPNREVPEYVRAQAELPITLVLRREATAFAAGFYPWFSEWQAKNRAAQRRRDAQRRERKHRANIAKLALVKARRRKEEHAYSQARSASLRGTR